MRTLLILIALLMIAPAFDRTVSSKDTIVKTHFALKLLRGNYTKAQEDFLKRAIQNRRSISEGEARQLFSESDVRDIFFNIGKEDISTFTAVSKDKKVWYGLTKEQKNEVRRIAFAQGIGNLELNEVQLDFVLRLSKKLPTITNDERDLFQIEAIELFTREQVTLIFGIRSSSTPCTTNLEGDPVPVGGNCGCSIGSSFNMQCNNGCASATCTKTDDGCGFAWLYSCDGGCSSSS